MSYDLMFQKANSLYINGSLDEAEQLYRHILEAVPENPDVLNMMGLTAQAKNMHQQAVSYFSQALKFPTVLTADFLNIRLKSLLKNH